MSRISIWHSEQQIGRPREETRRSGPLTASTKSLPSIPASNLEQQEGLEYGLQAHHIWTETAIGTSAGRSHLVGDQRPLGTSSLPISAVFRRRFATNVQVAACREIERPAEPVCSASVVDIVALQSLLPLYSGPL